MTVNKTYYQQIYFDDCGNNLNIFSHAVSHDLTVSALIRINIQPISKLVKELWLFVNVY